MSTENGSNEKVAGVVTFEISPAQRNLQVLSMSIRDFVEENSRQFSLMGQVQIDAQARAGEQLLNLESVQQTKIQQIVQDGNLKRMMAEAAFNQQAEQSKTEHGMRLQLLEQETQAALETVAQTTSLKMIAALQLSEARREAVLQESSLRQMNLSDKLFRDQEAHEERMNKLRAQSAQAQLKLEESALKQFESMDKLHYQALQADGERDLELQKSAISAQMREIKTFYDLKLASAEDSLARVELLLTQEADFFAQNEDKKYQLMKLGQSMRRAMINEENALDKAHYQALNENRARDEAALAQSISRKLAQIKGYYDIKLVTAKESLSQLEALMDQEAVYFQQNQDKQLQAFRLRYQIQNQIKAEQTGNFSGGIGGFLTNSAQMATGLAMFAVVGELMKIPKMIEDVSASMTKLKQVLELSDQIHGVQQLNDSLGQLQKVAEHQAVLYGQNVSTVLDVMTQAGRRFKDVPSIIVATDNALQAMVADNVDAEKAIKGEEAMMAQFGLSLGETRDAWAKLTVASHEFLTDASSIIDAVERSGSSFKGMKMNTDSAIAAIVALSQQSGRTGAVVGNSWKSIENTLGSQKGIEALHQIGIEAETSNGQLVDGLTVLGKLQAKWPELSEASRQAFATVLAGGKYQYNQLLTFLNDTSGTFVKALDAMKTANQETQRQLVESALQSLPKQMQMTSAAMQVMTNQFANVLTPAMMTFFKDLREGSLFVGEHAATIEHLIGTGMKLAEAYLMWKVGLMTYNAVVETAIGKQLKLSAELVTTTVKTQGAAAGFKVLGGEMLAVGTTALTVAARIGALVAVVEVFNNIAARAANPLGEKEKDLQTQLDQLQKRKQDESNGAGTFGSYLKRGWDAGVGAIGNILNPQRAEAALKGSLQGDNTYVQIASVKKQLQDVQRQKQAEQEAEMKKMMDENQKMVDEMLKKASATHPDVPDMPSGTDTTMPDFSGSKAQQSAADYVRPFENAIKVMEENLKPFQEITKSLDVTIAQLSWGQENLANSLKYGATNANLASDAVHTYIQRLNAYKTQQDSLHSTNDEIRGDMAKIQEQMQAINPTNADPTTLSQGQQDALSKLSEEYDSLSSQLNENSQKWQEDVRAMAQATDDWLNDLYKLQANGLAPITRKLQEIENQLKTAKAAMSLDENKMSHGDDSLATMIDYAKNYQAELDSLRSKEANLNQQIEQHAQNIKQLEYTLNSLDKSSANYAQASQSLTQQIEQEKSAMADLKEQYSQTAIEAQSLADTVENQVIASLKDGYEAERNLQQKKLKAKYDDATKAVQKQIDAIDEQIDAMDRLNKEIDDQNELADLNNQLSNVKSQLNQEIVVDGKLTHTYDVQKATDLEKQIADKQKQIQRDADKQKLEDQKKTLEDQLKALQDEYDKEKEALDDYWDYRLQQDQLKQDAEQLIAQHGYANAIADAKTFAIQMNKELSKINWASISEGLSLAQGALDGIKEAGSNSPSLQDIVQAAGKDWQAATTQEEKDAIHKKLTDQLAGSGATFNNQTGEWSYQGKILNGANAGKDVAHLSRGGGVERGKEGLAYLHEEEVVSDALTVRNFKVVPPMIEELRARVSALPTMLSHSIQPSKVTKNSTVYQTLQIGDLVFPNVTNPSHVPAVTKTLLRTTKNAFYSLQAGVNPN